ncbi:MAG: hypothetical protein GXP14_11965 [Gammaproteobacteria bacterium]|nr:hypothetical protein [Gammaproteobacteria bacterium]
MSDFLTSESQRPETGQDHKVAFAQPGGAVDSFQESYRSVGGYRLATITLSFSQWQKRQGRVGIDAFHIVQERIEMLNGGMMMNQPAVADAGLFDVFGPCFQVFAGDVKQINIPLVIDKRVELVNTRCNLTRCRRRSWLCLSVVVRM